MLFNSYEFVFFFLPLTALVFYLFGRRSKSLAIGWLILASLAFYAWWRPLNVALIAPSILINYGLSRALLRWSNDKKERASKALLIAGIAFNVMFLGYFKYANFIVSTVNDVAGTHYVFENVILPLGISFITFQKIAFLVDVASGRVKEFTLRDYCLFVLFFPQLIAGPIVHYREVMPQFHAASCRFDPSTASVGLTLFFAGLFKKAVLADGISPLVTVIYRDAAAGHPITMIYAWMAAVGFTLQIYFDFSGYSDMAIGAARLFGITLPANFNSPLRASSIVDFWLRWHMTLTRFLTAYIYNPLSLWLTRRRMAKGLKGLGGKNASPGAFITVLMLPTLLTMCVSGLWHGAGYTFIFWGFLHGMFLTCNHLWIVLTRRYWPGKERFAFILDPMAFLLTFIAVVSAMVFFKSSNMRSAWNLIGGMIGLHGIAMPATTLEHFGAAGGVLRAMLPIHIAPSDSNFTALAYWIAGLLTVAWCCPNTLQILAAESPASGVDLQQPYKHGPRLRLQWNTSLVWMLAATATTVVAVLHLGGVSEFLYWQF
jgi:D-alanyl-lipoteichoic acid acyltransferase DltB (MBOAT superfamily)